MLLGSSIFLLPNGTFFVELILFLAIFGFVAKVILPPLNRAMDERARTVRDAQEASDEGQAEAERLVIERHEVLESARGTARGLLEEAAAEADRLYEDGRARGQAEHDRLLDAARPDIDAERESVETELLGRVGELVIAAAGRVVGEPVDAAKHRAIIDNAVAQLAATNESEA